MKIIKSIVTLSLFLILSCTNTIENNITESTIRISITGEGVDTISIAYCLSCPGSEDTVTDELVAEGSSWEIEIPVNRKEESFFVISAKNRERVLLGSGSVTQYSEKKVLDDTAVFTSLGIRTSSAENGTADYAVNETDNSTYAEKIEAVVSDTELELNNDIFPVKHGKYEIRENSSGQLRKSGTAKSISAGRLVDTEGYFLTNGIQAADIVKNLSSDPILQTAVNTVVSESEIALDNDIFTERSEDYIIYKTKKLSITVTVDEEENRENIHWDCVEVLFVAHLPPIE